MWLGERLHLGRGCWVYFPQEEYEDRWGRVYGELAARGYEVAVVFGRSGGTYERCGNVLWLTNFYSSVSGHGLRGRTQAFSAVILAGGEMPELHTGEPSPNGDLLATDRVRWDVSDSSRGADPIRSVCTGLKERKVSGPVAMVGFDFLPVLQYQRLQEMLPEVSWVPEDDVIEVVSRVKSPRELDCYRRAGENASAALTALMEGLIACKPEAEAAALASYELLRRGGNFQYIPVNHGDSLQYFTRSPLNGFSEDAPEPGDMVRGWVWGPMYQGYWLDPGRTAVAGGKPTGAQQALLERCITIIDTLMDAIRPGVSVYEVGQLGDRLQAEASPHLAQSGEMFPVYGHGVGMLWQQPMIGTRWPVGYDTFESGMVLGVEAFISEPGVGTADFEQNIILNDDGPELLLTTPMLWN